MSEEYFLKQRSEFVAALSELTEVSQSISNRFVPARFGWASLIYARMGLAATSIDALLKYYVDDHGHSTIDHGTVGSVCRSILEMQVFVGYLVEDDISDEEWTLRKWTLDIHDCQGRIRLFRSLSIDEQKNEGKSVIRELQERIKTSLLFGELDREVQTQILSGRRIYVRGLRAALPASGWEEHTWDGVYAYLSGPSHAAPISSYKSEESGLDNLSIVPHQYAFCAFAMEFASKSMRWASGRMRQIFSSLDDLVPSDKERGADGSSE